MKTRILIAALLCCSFLSAQPNKGGEIRDKMMRVQAGEIVSGLQLDERRSEQFKAIYARYFKEMSANESAKGSNIRSDSTITDEQADKLIRQEFEMLRRGLRIREKYYEEFRTVLSSSEIYRMYAIERQMRRRISTEAGRRIHQGPGKPNDGQHQKPGFGKPNSGQRPGPTNPSAAK